MHRITMTAEYLHKLRAQAQQLPPLVRQKTTVSNLDSALAVTGSGLNFLEHRPYETGDSPRIMDWSLTAKKGAPWVRQFHEDTTNTYIFFLDLSAGLFFGSKRFCKSVILLQTMALIGWQAVEKGFKTGCVIQTEEDLHHIKPDSGSEHFSSLIKQVIKLYHLSLAILPASPEDREPRDKNHLESGLLQLHNYINQHDHIIILSDFITGRAGIDLSLRSLRKKTSVSAVRISDPLETGSLPEGHFPVSDGGQDHLIINRKQSFAAFCKKHNQAIKNCFSSLGIRLIELSTQQESYCQLKRLMADRRQLHHG